MVFFFVVGSSKVSSTMFRIDMSRRKLRGESHIVPSTVPGQVSRGIESPEDSDYVYTGGNLDVRADYEQSTVQG